VANTLGPFYGEKTSPAANAYLIAPMAGGMLAGYWYVIDITVYIDGTTAPADDDNIVYYPLDAPGTRVHLAVPATPAGTAPAIVKYSFTVQYIPGGVTALQVLATATSGSVYHACITITLIDNYSDLPEVA
jgi:hypothetical protein